MPKSSARMKIMLGRGAACMEIAAQRNMKRLRILNGKGNYGDMAP
jgi:hypothetical protein